MLFINIYIFWGQDTFFLVLCFITITARSNFWLFKDSKDKILLGNTYIYTLHDPIIFLKVPYSSSPAAILYCIHVIMNSFISYHPGWLTDWRPMPFLLCQISWQYFQTIFSTFLSGMYSKIYLLPFFTSLFSRGFAVDILFFRNSF